MYWYLYIFIINKLCRITCWYIWNFIAITLLNYFCITWFYWNIIKWISFWCFFDWLNNCFWLNNYLLNYMILITVITWKNITTFFTIYICCGWLFFHCWSLSWLFKWLWCILIMGLNYKTICLSTGLLLHPWTFHTLILIYHKRALLLSIFRGHMFFHLFH